MEYPGYGIYKNESPDSELIQQNAEVVFEFITHNLHYDPSDIIVFGRSMGSGPACYLASNHKVSSLILLSAYTSLKNVVKSLVGYIPSLLVKERFENYETIKRVECPTLIIHGQNDQLIPYQHSQILA